MKRKEDFLAEIIAEPDADAPRLIYADWLEENGIDPARAEFIRIQCELAKTPPCPRIAELREKLEAAYTDLNITGRFVTFIPTGSESITVANYCTCPACRLGRREEELLTAHAATKWLFDLPPGLRPILPDAQKKAFRRGFIAEITLPCADWLAHREEILRMCPLEKVTVTHLPPEYYSGPEQSSLTFSRGQMMLLGSLNGRILDLSFGIIFSEQRLDPALVREALTNGYVEPVDGMRWELVPPSSINRTLLMPCGHCNQPFRFADHFELEPIAPKDLRVAHLSRRVYRDRENVYAMHMGQCPQCGTVYWTPPVLLSRS